MVYFSQLVKKINKVILTNEKDFIKNFKSKEDSPYLVSFPRTGSHWLRMILEKYSDRPLLDRSFFEHDNSDYLLIHTHDMNLTIRPKNCIYLYRNAEDVIFSQLNYYKQDLNDDNLVIFWLYQYLGHVSHWVLREKSSQKKTLVKYEKLKGDYISQLKPIIEHLNLKWEEEKMKDIYQEIDKKAVAKKTQHDPQVISKKQQYEHQRFEFKNKYNDLFLNEIISFSKKVHGEENKLLDILNGS